MKRKSILVIHRDDQCRREMHSILSHFNFNLIYADDGLHGLHAAKYKTPDLIISEINIAVLNGLNMSKMLRNDETTKNIPIVFLHDELNFSYIKMAKGINVNAFLVKPYLDNSLIYAIKRSLDEQNLYINEDRQPMRYEDCKITPITRVQYA